MNIKNVLSLFDGMSCGQQALTRSGIKYENYFASEVDKYAITITQKNFQNTVQLGDVRNVKAEDLQNIDLLIGGSPCQSFSFAGKRKGMSTKDEIEILTLEHYLSLKKQNFEFEGQSYLFWEYMRLLIELKPKYFLLENVIMGEKWERILSKAIGYNPIEINSALVSAQNRRRLYWTNIGTEASGLFGFPTSIIPQPKDKGILLKDVLQPIEAVDEKYFLSENLVEGFKVHAQRHEEKGTGFAWNPTEGEKNGAYLRANGALCPTDNIIVHNNKREIIQLNQAKESNNLTQPFQQNRIYSVEGIAPGLSAQLPNGLNIIIDKNIYRRLTPIECERLQTVEDNYTEGVSDSQRYKMLGNGWTVDVISHIFSYIK